MNPLYAAALQDHIASKYSISAKPLSHSFSLATSRSSSKSLKSLSTRQKQLLRWSKSIQKSSGTTKDKVDNYEWNASVVARKGGAGCVYGKTGFVDKYLDATPSTLAQRLGVIPHTAIDQTQWSRIKSKSLNSLFISSQTQENHTRLDVHATLECPICHESFLNTTQTLTCCSHLFHSDCLASWERLVTAQPSGGMRKCPVCRRENYHRLQTKCGHEITFTRAVVLIQSWWRGRLQYLSFQKVWLAHVPKDVGVRRRKLERQLDNLSSCLPRISTHGMNEKNRELDAFMDGLEIGNAAAVKCIKEALDKLEGRRKRKSINSKAMRFWKRVLDKIVERGPIECVICLNSICLEMEPHTNPSCHSLADSLDSPINSTYPSNSSHPTHPTHSTHSTTNPPTRIKKKKKAVMFECSHILHAPCFTSYETLLATDPSLNLPQTSVTLCPVCRHPTAKRKYINVV